MNSIETLLAKKMVEAEPTLDILGFDNNVLQVALQDLRNYLKCDGKGCNVIKKMELSLGEEPVEVESFMMVWVGMWLRKWKTRVKLILGDQRQIPPKHMSETLSKADPLWNKLECRQEMIGILVSSLIRSAEICGTEMLAANLLKKELGKSESQDVNSKENVVAVLNGALRTARELALGVGPLMFVKVDKGYFGALKN